MATQLQSPLLALPQELQDRIYRFHFTIRDKITPVLIPSSRMFFYRTFLPRVGLYEEEYQDRSFLNMPGRPSFPHSRLALLLVCRNIYRDFQHTFLPGERLLLLGTIDPDVLPYRYWGPTSKVYTQCRIEVLESSRRINQPQTTGEL